MKSESGLPLFISQQRDMFVGRQRPRRVHLFLCVALAFVTSILTLGQIFSLAPCAVPFSSKCYRGYQSYYSFDAGVRSRESWMGHIPDSVNLTSLSVPGTHDTMTFDLVDERFQCQNHNLSTQLRAGIRYLDIRGRLRNDSISIYHASMFTGYTYTDVLLDVFAFLEENPSETVIMRLKEEGPRVRVDGAEMTEEELTEATSAGYPTFEEVFNHHRLEDPVTAPGCAAHFYLPSSGFDRLPALGDLRGKVFILQNFPSQPDNQYGIKWDGPQMRLEDLWIIPSVHHLWMKWDAIVDALSLAASVEHDDPASNAALFVSHLSASVGVLPIEAAAGPLNHSVEGMNDATGEWLDETLEMEPGNGGRTGVVIMDFAGQNLIDEILRRNEEGWMRRPEL